MRGQRQDYDHWAQLGNRGWSYQDVLPIFKRMEAYAGGDGEFRGRDGPLRVTDSAASAALETLHRGGGADRPALNRDYNGAGRKASP